MPADGQPAPTRSPDARVGVVVLTYNRVREVLRTIGHLVTLPERPRVLVVDNGSHDGTTEAIRQTFSPEDVVLVPLASNLGAAGRNVGVELCDRQYVALCDDDTWWQPGSLTRAADLLDAYPSLAVVCGRVLVGPEERLDPTSVVMRGSPLAAAGLPGPALLGFLAGASLVRRSAFLSVGGFCPRLFLGSEEELVTLDLATAGWRLTYADDVVIHHYPSRLRDAGGRRRLIRRNRLWVAWTRRSWRHAVAVTLAAAAEAFQSAEARQGLGAAVVGLPWALRTRRPIPAELERALQLLEHPRSGGTGRGRIFSV